MGFDEFSCRLANPTNNSYVSALANWAFGVFE